MKQSAALDLNRSAVFGVVGRCRAANPRVFCSVPHGTDRDGGDLDLLVDAPLGATLSSCYKRDNHGGNHE